jgi:hypothetical protein
MQQSRRDAVLDNMPESQIWVWSCWPSPVKKLTVRREQHNLSQDSGHVYQKIALQWQLQTKDTEMKLISLRASSMLCDSVCLPSTYKDELSSNMLCSAFCFIDMLKVWAIVFRNLFSLRQKLWRILGFSKFHLNWPTKKKPTQPPYHIRIFSSLIEDKREVLVYECIDRGWNLESSHYSWKQFVPILCLN